MGEARKRKLQAVASRAADLPESLKFVPSVDAPTNGPHAKKQKTVAVVTPAVRHQDTHLLTLQAEQLLKAIRPKHDADDNLAKLGESVQKAIRSIPDVDPMQLPDVYKLSKKSKVSLPFLSIPPDDLQLKFAYSEPESITVGGLVVNKMRSKAHADELELLVELPASIIQEKDYLNSRVHYKMAFYLFTIARSMKSKYHLTYVRRRRFGIEGIDLQVAYKDRQVVVRLVLPPDLFPEPKLDPIKNADRSSQHATPSYNAHILLLMRMTSLSDMITTAAEDSPHFRDSILLAERYLAKRSLSIQVDQWALITACLLQGGGKNGGKLLSPNASAMQLFRGTALFLSQFFDSVDNSITFGDAQTAPGCWIRGFNLFSHVSAQEKVYLGFETKFITGLLTDEAKDAIKVFDCVFLEEQKRIGVWDLQFTIRSSSCHVVDIEQLWRTLKKALAERATLIRVMRPTEMESTVAVTDSQERTTSDEIYVGMKLKRPFCQASMILGPPATSTEAKSFRSFWGTLSDLRKFQDGRILETVALSTNNPSLDVCQKILGLHFPNLPDLGSWTIHGADSAAELKLVSDQRKLAAEFEEFARVARDLEDLPLRITSISSSDAIFAACAGRIPGSIEGVIQFESSARWPDDIEAIQRMKIAFLLALQKSFATLMEDPKIAVQEMRVLLENQSSTSVNASSSSNLLNLGILQITMSSGIDYRLRIYLDREKTLLTTYLKSAQAKLDSINKARHQEALAIHEDLFEIADLHSEHIRNAASTYPAYSEAVIRLKHWFAAHLLSEQCSNKVAELIVLNVLSSETGIPSDSPTALFYCIMQFLAAWDWRQDCIMLEHDKEKRAARLADFQKLKQQDPGHSVAIYTPYSSKVVTISKFAAFRMTSLAKASHDRLQQGYSIESTMKTPMNHFDFVIHLAAARSLSKYKNVEVSKDDSFNHAQSFTNELRDIYGQTLSIFTAPESTIIAVVIEPALLQPRNFKPNLGFPTKPVKSDTGLRVVLDIDVLIAEIQRLGDGVVARIDRKKV